MLERWDTLTRTTHEYEFVLVMRFDFDGDITRLLELCSTYAPTNTLRLDGSRVGFPGACSEMWAKTMAYIGNCREDVSFAFWMEYDVMPQGSNWLDYFIRMWDDRFHVMGHFVSNEWLDANGYKGRDGWGSHINGAACYHPRVSELAMQYDWGTELAWDVQLAGRIDPDNNMALNLYEFRLNPDRDSPIRDNRKLLVHGVKTIEEKEQMLAEMGERDLPDIVIQHQEPFNGDAILQGTVYGLIQAYQISTVVETGCFTGVTTRWFDRHADFTYGIEINQEYYELAKAHDDSGIYIHGDSLDILPGMINDLEGSVLFYLDSHWQGKWPLLDELRIIGESVHATTCVIVIHDYKTGELGYDEYAGQVLDENYLKPVLDSHFRYAHTFTNKEAIGHRRGALFIIGESIF
jgi:hypothetical protein